MSFKKFTTHVIIYLFLIAVSLTVTLRNEILKLHPRNANTIYHQVIVPMAWKINPHCRKSFNSKSCQDTVNDLMMRAAEIWYNIDHRGGSNEH